MEEPQSGGLIDWYWIFQVIIIPLFLILTIIGILYLIGLFFSCPYTEDVSSCFPYNLPNWLKWCFHLIVIILATVLTLIIKYSGRDENGNSTKK